MRLRHLGYRVFQFLFYASSHLLPWRVPVLLEGAGAVDRLPAAMLRFRVRRALVVTDRGVRGLGLADGLLAALERDGIAAFVFDGVKANPTVSNVEAARAAYLANGCQGFVAIGGGSPIDVAKAASARIARPRTPLSRLGGFLKVLVPVPPVFAIPTTAGTGSEVTVAAVVVDDATRHKYCINDTVLIPVCAVHDPLLTVGLPKAITASTGMDVLTHAVEAYLTQGVTKRCRRQSEEAVRRVFADLPRAFADGTDLAARQSMLTAAFLSGDAFTRAGLTYVHALGHAISGLYDEPHGFTNAVLLAPVLEAFGATVHGRLARLARAAGLDVEGRTEAESAQAFVAAIRALNATFGIPATFPSVRREDIPTILDWAYQEAHPWYRVPRFLEREELAAVIERVLVDPRKESR